MFDINCGRDGVLAASCPSNPRLAPPGGTNHSLVRHHTRIKLPHYATGDYVNASRAYRNLYGDILHTFDISAINHNNKVV